MLTFDEKVMALASIRALGLSKAVFVFARAKRIPSPTMREMLHELDAANYLLDDGVVELTSAGVLQYVELHQPAQPIPLTQEYFHSCKEAKQEAMADAISILGASGKLRSLKPYVVVKKVRTYEKKKTVGNLSAPTTNSGS